MLDFVYYPVSAVLWLWHSAFSALIPSSSALSWVFAVVFLVLTLRALLVVPFMKQARLQLTMRRLQPQIAAIQKRHRTDRRRQAAEIQKLHREHGVNVLLGLLPMLAQTLVFIGLFHVLLSFDRTPSTMGVPFLGRTTPMSAEQNLHTTNYAFSADQVQSFLGTRLFGAPLVASIHTANGHIGAVAMVAIPLMIVAAVATHFTARASFVRQPNSATATSVVRALSLWILPGSALVSGAFLPWRS
jgi:YidC/Oxa1 family membrane protein insertase